MRQTIDSKSKFLAGAIETTEGVRPADPAFILLRTRNLEPKAYDGSTQRREYDGDDGRANPTVKSNRHTTFSFDADFAGSGDPAKLPALDSFLRMGGLSRVAVDENDANQGYQYLISHPADMDAGTLLVRRKAERRNNGTDYITYESNGVRGYIGIQLQAGSDPLFQFRDFKGSYQRPLTVTEANDIDVVYEQQAYAAIFEDGNVPLFQFGLPDSNGAMVLRDVCLHEFNVANYSGVTISRNNAVNCGGTQAKATPIDFTAKVGYDDDYWQVVESHQGIVTLPFAMQHGTSNGNILTISAQKVQIHDIQEVDIDGELGMDLSGSFLDRPILTLR